jgi:hypothetical protein
MRNANTQRRTHPTMRRGLQTRHAEMALSNILEALAT